MIFSSIAQRHATEAEQAFMLAHRIWKTEFDKKTTDLNAWKARKAEFETALASHNAAIDELKRLYQDKDEKAVVEYVKIALGNSKHPDYFPRDWRVDFIGATGVMVIDYELPSLDDMPKLKAVKYVQTRDAFENVNLKDSAVEEMYENTLYQVSLRTIREIFSTDTIDVIQSITFNGWVNFIDKTNGKPSHSCIMSVQAKKPLFQEINLSAVDPKACFRSLKGVGSAKLAGMTAVVPILQLDRNDPRFIPAHDAIDSVGATTNVAAISWEEFEFLVRDIFEKEFSSKGGEVKITRASRDHGVDAIAFDPDPIRGGKIVIQAKRYTNVVGVSAVRDLYGTLINEGANRGILVTTSQYGPDSYEFAKGKPITLLDGGNLLSLLERHGHKARIDLEEAKRLGLSREQH